MAGLVSAVVLAAAMPLAHAAWPDKPIRLVVPYGPGGSSDVIARLLANEMGKTFGQAVVVDNKAGGSGIIAMQEVARALPDGYTVVLGHVGTLAVNPAMFAKLPYRDEDFAPVVLLAKVPMVFAVGAKVPAQNFAEFVALAKAQPGKLNYGSAGNGSTGHLAFEMLKVNEVRHALRPREHHIPLVQRKPGAPIVDMPDALQRLRRGPPRQAEGDR
jgi:tripartite-type tricarboxylate transporter receptor subunit TctC